VTSPFPSARPALRQLWARLLRASGCLWWAKRQLRRRGARVVLTFHRVLNDAEFQQTCSLSGIVVRRQTFEKLADYVTNKYQVVDFEAAAKASDPRLRLLFTFDDGWKDNYTNAFPVMRQRGIPSTIFVCSGLVGRKLPFWPELVASILGNVQPAVSGAATEALIEELKTYAPAHRTQYIARLYELHTPIPGETGYEGDETVSWDEIREMAAAGVRFGCHTQTHQILTAVPAETARREVRESKRAIERALQQPCDLFAYPNGNSSLLTRRMMAEEGFTAAFTTRRAAWTAASDPMAIPRVNVCEQGVTGTNGGFSPAMFEYNVFWKAWRATRAERRVTEQARPKPAPEAFVKLLAPRQ